MKVLIHKDEVYKAVVAYMLLKGNKITSRGFNQRYTNAEGLQYLEFDIEKHNYTEESVIEHIKNM